MNILRPILLCLLILGFVDALYAQTTINGRAHIKGDTPPTTGAGVEIGYSNNVGQVVAYDRSTSAYKFLYLSGSELGFITSGTERMRILANGNVGIGTINPNRKFHISGTGDIEQSIEATDNGFASITFKSNGKSWNLGKRPGTQQDALQLYYNNGTAWSTSFLTVLPSGNVGLGTGSPASQLHIASNTNHAFTMSRADGSYGFRITRDATYGIVYFQIGTDVNTWETKIRIGEGEGANTKLILNPDGGNVGIGTNNPDAKLTVNGTIHSKEVKVDLNITGPDYVFEADYNLPTLSEIENYIKQNKHLPEVPSAKEMEQNGIKLSEMNMILLKKVEELTLHLIELKKENEEQNKLIKKFLTKENK